MATDYRRMPASPTQFSGEEQFTVEPARLYAVMTDLDVIAAMIPDLVSHQRVNPQTLECVVRPGFSFLRGTMKLSIGLADLMPPEKATMNVAAAGIGIGMQVRSHLEISSTSTGSLLKWQAEIHHLKGLIATVSPGLVRAAADQVVRQAWQLVHQRVGG
jgi:carbon monoxide dehydrogenase subunit G